jgi:hypothetical protein
MLPLNMCILILNINGPIRAEFCTKREIREYYTSGVLVTCNR